MFSKSPEKLSLQTVKQRGWSSRKYRTAWYLTWLLTFLLLAPPLASFMLAVFTGIKMSFSIIPAEDFIYFLAGIWFVYFGTNLAEKTAIFGHLKSEKAFDDEMELNAREELTGGQPYDD